MCRLTHCLIALLCLLLCQCSSLRPTEAEDDTNSERRPMETKGPAPTPLPARTAEVALPSKENPLPELAVDGVIKKKVLVLPFQNRSLIGGTEIGGHAAQIISDRLGKMPEYVVVVPEELNGTESLQNDYGEYRMKTIFERCRANGISGIILGSIEDIFIQEQGDEVGLLRSRSHQVSASLKFQLYDVSTERLLLSRLASAETIDETTRLLGARNPDSYDSRRSLAAISQALENPLAQMPAFAKRIAWIGRIARVDLHRYYINAGEATGLTKGQLLRVFSEGQPVVDQESGEMLGMAPGRFKGTLKVVDFFGSDSAVAVLHTGAGFREKDRVDVLQRD